MSAESFAVLRRTRQADLRALAEDHYKHDLTASDRELLESAARTTGRTTLIASALGLGLGFMLAHRIRTNRLAFYRAMRTAEKPTHLLFANGKKTEIPDMTPLLRPSRFGDFAAYTFFSAGGLFVFGELGLLIGSWWAKRSILKDEGTRKRIDEAFRAFRLDVLKKEAKELESGKGERAW